MKKWKNNLDEMQEQELLKIEHNGCWIAFWLLLAAILIQSVAFGYENPWSFAGEMVVFMILSLYMAFACMRKGIWDRHLGMDRKTNLVVSLIAAAVVGLFNAFYIFRNYHKPFGTALASLIIAAITFVICFALLAAMAKATKKNRDAMDAEPEEGVK